jgi:hypothetical protein
MPAEIFVADNVEYCTIGVESSCAMFAGDPGTTVYASIDMSRAELLSHIAQLAKIWRSMKPIVKTKPKRTRKPKVA